MLLYNQSFMTKYGIRNAQYLATPTITSHDEITMLRNTVVHYLDQSSPIRFPNINMYFLQGMETGKKVRTMNVIELVEDKGVSTIRNRYARQETKVWRDSHKKNYLVRDLNLKPNTDEAILSLYNYNILKDLWNYTDTVTRFYDYNHNIMKTYLTNVKKALSVSPSTNQVVQFRIPNIIPGYAVMNKILGFEPKKQSSTLDDSANFWLMEYYKWLVRERRQESLFNMFTDQEVERILIDINYRGYSVFIRLSTLDALSKDSDQPSIIKLNDEKIAKYFLAFLIDIQDKITEMSLVDATSNKTYNSDEDPLDYKSDDEYDDAVDEEEEVRNGTRPAVLVDTSEPEDDLGEDEDERKDTKGATLLISKGRKKQRGKLVDELDDENFKGTTDEDLILKRMEDYDNRGAALLLNEKRKKKNASIFNENDESGLSEEDTIVPETDEDGFVLKVLSPEEKEEILASKNVDDIINEYIEENRELGTISDSEIRSINVARDKRNNLKSPYNPSEDMNTVVDEPLEEIPINQEAAKIKVPVDLVDENLKNDKIKRFTKEYSEKVYKKEIVRLVMSLEAAGLIVTDYQIEPTKSIADNFETHRVTIRPLKGKPSTIYFRMPVLDEEGTFMVAGNRYTMRKVKHDLPIRKISPTRVALSSAYGKFFVERSPRVASSPDEYISKFIINDYLNARNFVTKIVPGKKDLNLVKNLPVDYYMLASRFDVVKLRNMTLLFKEGEQEKILSAEKRNEMILSGKYFVGYTHNGNEILYMGDDNIIYNLASGKPLGFITDILGLKQSKLPKPFSTIKVLGSDIPFGVCMAYLIGFSQLVSYLDIRWKLVPNNKRYTPEGNETELRFNNTKIILDLDTQHKKLIMNGFLFYKDFIKQYPLNMFESREIYLNLVQFRGCNLIHLKELEALDAIFLDPITIEVLASMKEPTTFKPLLFRANSLLSDFSHPDITDPDFARIRGNERITTLMYKAISESVREQIIRGKSTSQIKLDRFKVWNYVTQDSSLSPVDEVNPILTIKNNEIVTLAGRDGLKPDAVANKLRVYHPKETGLISEATADSSNAAIVSYLSPYAKIKDIRGMVESGHEETEENPAKVLSTPVQISPMSEYDDQLRNG